MKLGVLYSKFGTSNRRANRVHSVFAKRAEMHGISVFFAPYKMYSGGYLKKSACYQNKKWVIVENQEIDVVYSRFGMAMYLGNRLHKNVHEFKENMSKEIPIVNNTQIDDFCWDKRIVAEMFPEHTPKTFLINSLKGLVKILPQIDTEKIVLKPRFGSMGNDVIIVDKKDIPLDISRNTIVQEFIDTSSGIDGVVDKRHDLRLVMVNGEVDHAHIRIPKKGKLVANVAQGGRKVFIKKEQIPASAIDIAKKIDSLFRVFSPRIFSVDFLFDNNGKPYVVECNSQPMIDKYAYGKWADLTFYDRMFEAMKRAERLKNIC